MNRYSFFDLIPVELFYILFEYFWAHEILFTFFGMNNHVNSVLVSYSAYRLNLKSIQKSYFDLICRHIRPEQVILLILSDKNDTPGQSELFLSHFQIQQFTHLQSLTLIDIECESLYSILSNLYKLDHLRSFSFDASIIKGKSGQFSTDESKLFTRLSSILPNFYNQVLPRLKYLYLKYGNDLPSTPLPHLLHLKLDCWSFKEFNQILYHASQLKSAILSLSFFRDFDHILPSFVLTQLSLTIESGGPISIDNVEKIFKNFPCLTYFEIKVNNLTDDLADGYRWQLITQSLTTFNFKFKIKLDSIEKTLNSFRTPFWLEEKHWFVAYHNSWLFSIPYSGLTDINIEFDFPIYSTVSDNTIIYENKTTICQQAFSINNKYRFTHIKVLDLNGSVSFQILSSIIDVSQVEYLSITIYQENLLKVIVQAMPHLHSLSVRCRSISYLLEEIQGIRMKQIRTLELYNKEEQKSYVVDVLSHSFPSVERLSTLCIKSRSDIIHVVNKFKELSSISFYIHGSSEGILTYSDFEPDLIMSEIRQFTHGSVACRVERSLSNGTPEHIHLWIGERLSHVVSDTYWLPRRGYLWFRTTNFLFNRNTNIIVWLIFAIINFHINIPYMDDVIVNVLFHVLVRLAFALIISYVITFIIVHYFPFRKIYILLILAILYLCIIFNLFPRR